MEHNKYIFLLFIEIILIFFSPIIIMIINAHTVVKDKIYFYFSIWNRKRKGYEDIIFYKNDTYPVVCKWLIENFNAIDEGNILRVMLQEEKSIKKTKENAKIKMKVKGDNNIVIHHE